MKIKFVGVPNEKHDSVTIYGQTFPLDKYVEVNDPTAQRKLSKHPHFEVKPGDEIEDAKVIGDGATQLADLKAQHNVATAQLQGKVPAPNAFEGLPTDKPSRADMEAAAKAKGIKIDARWGDDRLQAEIDKAK